MALFTKSVEVIQTKDGRTFRNQSEADEHVADKVREYLSNQLDILLKKGKLSRSEQFSITMALIPDIDAVEDLYTMIDKLTVD